ncbi:MFS transporter [Streptomyces sp. Ncost-T10-10d]|uniref:MFS transporter n=1 Tax=Streptomyces sp. Ncost-T10-10d TaxID=1839774 RepID=UPI00081D9918|nr:MFS transporter [Streptomyces sp. Ncost-T10-10d]SCF56749.1 Predicted arabinose efflux permease, MFS family [Streptomyces sp. Ncost-T10-10d]
MPTEAVPPSPPQPDVAHLPTTPGEKPRSWRQVALLGGLISADSGEGSVVSVLFPALRTALGLPLAALGVLVGVGKLVGVVFGPVWVAVAERYPRKNVLGVCSGLWGVWTIAAGFAQNYVQLLVLFTIAAAGVAGGGPLVNGLLADLFDDRMRGRAAGYMYGLASLATGISGPLLGLLSDVKDGWRYGFFVAGSIQVVFGVLILLFLRDPGVGAAEPQAAGAASVERALTWARARELLGNRSLLLICVQRLTTGQFVVLSFGVTFLVDVRGFANSEASFLTVPFAIAYFAGTFLGGLVTDRVHRRNPRTGRVAALQFTVFAYALGAYVTTQFVWSSLGTYIALFSVLAFVQGATPGINRPLVMSVTLPEMRSAAFALMLSAEAAGWAFTTVLVGYIGDAFGLQAAFLWVVVVLMLANGILLTLLYRTCPRDASALQAELDRRAAGAGAGPS